MLFYVRIAEGMVYVTDCGEIIYSLLDGETGKVHVFKECFIGSRYTEVLGEEETITRVSYFKGKEPSKWKSNLATYNYVNLGEIYDGIELKLRAVGNNVEKIFTVTPFADPNQIRIRIEGSDVLEVNGEGELGVNPPFNSMGFFPPVAFQVENSDKEYIDVRYIEGGDEYSFMIEDYDRSQELVIDPLIASTFLGGLGGDRASSIAVVGDTIVFVAGITKSYDFPTSLSGYDPYYNGGFDAFVSKFNYDLANLLSSTFLGGLDGESNIRMFVSDSAYIYIGGSTRSQDFPTTPNAYDTTFNGGNNDVFLSKLDTDLTSLLASTLLGGSTSPGFDWAEDIHGDSNGNVFITGWTYSYDFPTTVGAYDTTFNDSIADIFISKFDSNLSNLLASTLFGGSEECYEYAHSITIDNDCNVYISGSSPCIDFPVTANAYDTTINGNHDCFISKFDNDLATLLSSTFLGGGLRDKSLAVEIGSYGNVYVTGWTWSDDFPTTPGAYDSVHVNSDAWDVFISIFDDNLEELLASTFLGGGMWDAGLAISIDSSGNAYVAGHTYSADFPTTPGAYDTLFGGGSVDAFIARLDSALQNLLNSTFLGCGGSDEVTSIWLDGTGYIYAVGSTGSFFFPANAYDTTYNGEGDAFVSKFDSLLSQGGAGVEEEPNKRPIRLNFTISPNPFATSTTIILYSRGHRVKNTELSIYDASGRLVESVKLTTSTYQLGADLVPGVYFMKLTIGEHKEIQKLIKIR